MSSTAGNESGSKDACVGFELHAPYFSSATTDRMATESEKSAFSASHPSNDFKGSGCSTSADNVIASVTSRCQQHNDMEWTVERQHASLSPTASRQGALKTSCWDVLAECVASSDFHDYLSAAQLPTSPDDHPSAEESVGVAASPHESSTREQSSRDIVSTPWLHHCEEVDKSMSTHQVGSPLDADEHLPWSPKRLLSKLYADESLLGRVLSPPKDYEHSVETVNISAPTNGPNESMNTTQTRRQQRKQESREWASSRQTALDRLRAELENPNQLPRFASNTVQEPSIILSEETGATPVRILRQTNVSSISGISPDKHPDLLSVLADSAEPLYRSPLTKHAAHAAKELAKLGSTPPSKLVGPEAMVSQSLTAVVASSSPENQTQLQGGIVGERSSVLELQQLPRTKRLTEASADVVGECTFNPAISPGTKAMVDLQMIGASSLPCPVDGMATTTVYERLYPQKLSDESDRKRRAEQKEHSRQLARQEMFELRRRLGAICTTNTTGQLAARDFEVSLSNILGRLCTGGEPIHKLSDSGALIETVYISPKSLAFLQKQNDHSDPTSISEDVFTEDCKSRSPLFTQFLERQRAHYTNRWRTVQEIRSATTPSFRPIITVASERILHSMIQRSTINDSTGGAETSSILQEKLKIHAPVGVHVVKKHKSPYVDPCTFAPKVSELAKVRYPKGRSGMYESLYAEQKRLEARRAHAKEQAEKEEVSYPFKPKLNTRRNAVVESFLDPKNYMRYEQYLRKKRETEDERKRAHAAKEEQDAFEQCTFRPNIGKKPTFISKMAESFGLVRQLDFEF